MVLRAEKFPARIDVTLYDVTAERKRVSFETSAANESGFTSSAVRQTPLTEIESPFWASSVTVRAAITMRASLPRGSTVRTLPSSSMIPVNI